MRCYQTNNAGVFLGPAVAYEDPLVPERYALPGGCVLQAPPAYEGHQQARWDGEAWIIEDAEKRAVLVDDALTGLLIAWDGEQFVEHLLPPPATTGRQLAAWNGREWIVEEVPPVVPTSASRLGLMRAWKEQGAWDQIKGMIADDPDAQDEWNVAIEIKRTDPLVQVMIAATGMTEGQVDALLVRANELAV